VFRFSLNRSGESVITRADRALSDGQLDLALSLYRRALDRNPGNPPIWLQCGHVLKETGRLREAEAAYRRAISYAPQSADPHLQLGHVLKLKGRTGEAEAAYLRAAALEPALPGHIEALRALGWSPDQIAALQAAVTDEPTDPARPDPTVAPSDACRTLGEGLRPSDGSLSDHDGAVRELDGASSSVSGTLADDHAVLFQQQQGILARLSHIEAQLAEFGETQRFDQNRIEAALFSAEGLTHLRDEFLQARASAEYQAVFDKRAPVVSVCVTTMNRASLLLERALTSLLAQTYTNLQVIVVGDHCTDDTAEQIARLGDPRISFVNLPRRGPYPRDPIDRWRVAGTVPANRALELVEGDFVTHLDEDDTFEPRRIEILLQKIRVARADLVFHRFWWQELDGSWTQKGNGDFSHAQATTSTILYHRYLARYPWDVFSYRVGEPEDWNRLRKFKMMRVRAEFVSIPLAHHYRFPAREPFVPQPDEEFLE
jgi:tetratricopeptide (TPR) repeat protein